MIRVLPLLALLGFALGRLAVAQTLGPGVYDLPPESLGDNESIGSNTTLNVLDGGAVGSNFTAGVFGQTSSNLVVNVQGGSIGGGLKTYAGAQVQVNEGSIGAGAKIYSGSSVDLQGGTMGGGLEIHGGHVSVDGGTLKDYVEIYSGSVLNVLSGDAGTIDYMSGSATMNVSGGHVDTRDTMFGTINLMGGSIGSRLVTGEGARLNVSGGELGNGALIYYKSKVVITGGKIGAGLDVVNGSSLEMTGGVIQSGFYLTSNSPARLAGGVIGDGIEKKPGSQVLQLDGIDFRLNGVPIDGLEADGDALPFDLPIGSVLTGTYADGTPFAYSSLEEDKLPAGSLLLKNVAPPIGLPTMFDIPPDQAPQGVHDGQTLNVGEGAAVADLMQAGWGSTVHMVGGVIGGGFEAAGATVNIAGGSVGGGFDMFHGSVLTLSGGQMGGSGELLGAELMMTGGSIGASLSGQSESTLLVSGGALGDGLKLDATCHAIFEGSEFYVDGQLVEGLENEGDLLEFDLSLRQVLSGTLADGTPFALTSFDGDSLPTGTLALARVTTAATGPTTIDAASDVVPQGIRGGQTLLVGGGATVPDLFNAGRGSRVEVTGGTIGIDFEAVAAEVLLAEGTIHSNFDAMDGSVVTMTGGELRLGAQVTGGSQFDQTGGVSSSISASTNASVAISGGTTGPLIAEHGAVLAASGGVIGDIRLVDATGTITGGELGNLEALEGSALELRGGFLHGGLTTAASSSVRLVGAEFRLDNEPIEFLVSPGDSGAIDVPDGSVLSGTFADGTPFVFSNIAPLPGSLAGGTLTLELADVPQASPTIIGLPSSPAPAGARAGQTVLLQIGGTLPADFVAAPDSRVVIEEGGIVGDNLRAVGAEIELAGGAVMGGMQLLAGSEMTMTSGTVNGTFRDELIVNRATLNLHGGKVTTPLTATNEATVNLYGHSFTLGGTPIEGLVAGEPLTLTARNGVDIAGVLEDGSPFQFRLQTSRSRSFDVFSADSLVTITLVEPLVLPGDYNGDGMVNLADYTVWRDNLGASAEALANNVDGEVVDEAHYATWKANFGESLPEGTLGTVSSIPEPGSIVMLLVATGIGGMVVRRRQAG
ncbi:PEP-CTERM sorting domain-containing protein [Aeoliella sp. SH292]|uniref:PEP-CTERM sorting domain-containing protein n=1 Tax=Aeoliella sp. SH292 TaxID=3454464 RepID=UPI003F96F83C